jgi:AcrR family transcriptional regulator
LKQASVPPSTRELIVEAADELFYQRGFEKTSFTDIADRVALSRGNFYYHFRTKDDILAAVIALRASRTQSMLDTWASQTNTPLERLRCFAAMLVQNRKDIQRFGCPVGTLCVEVAKLAHPSRGDASMIFGQFRLWLREQFAALGFKADADGLAMHLLARSQGVASLANAFQDEAFIRHEVELIEEWLQSLHAPRQRKTARPASGRSARNPH